MDYNKKTLAINGVHFILVTMSLEQSIKMKAITIESKKVIWISVIKSCSCY